MRTVLILNVYVGKTLQQYCIIWGKIDSTLEDSQLGIHLIQVWDVRIKQPFWPCSGIMDIEVEIAVIAIQILNFNVL